MKHLLLKRLLSLLMIATLWVAVLCPAFVIDGEEATANFINGLIMDTTGESRNDIESFHTYGLLSSKVDLSTSPAFPPIGDQGSLGSCAAFATTYYQFTYMVNSYLGRTVSTVGDAYSPKWVYTAFNGGLADRGVSFINCYDFLYAHGSLKWSDFPYNGDSSSANNYQGWPGTELKAQMRDALNIRLATFAGQVVSGRPYATLTIPGAGTPITSNQDDDLDDVKFFLSAGYVLTVGSWWDQMEIRTSEGTKEQVICRMAHNTETNGHAIAVVGYDDNIWVDLNGNGVCESGEKGAFKIANSWGTDWGNNGFIWVLYDALNEVSSVPGWETKLPSGREPIFAQSETDSSFYMIDIEEKDVMLIAESSFYVPSRNDDDHRNLVERTIHGRWGTGYVWTALSSNFIIPRSNQTYYSVNDYDNLCSPILSYLTGYEWGISTPGVIQSGILTDNLGNTVKVMSYNAQSDLYKTSLTLSMGDVNYDGVLTAKDANLVLAFAAKTTEASNLQYALADFNGDGKVNTADARLILTAAG